MKLVKLIPVTEVIFAKSISLENTYFIFRNNSEEVAITVTENHTIKSSHILQSFEMDFLREEYPQFFKKII